MRLTNSRGRNIAIGNVLGKGGEAEVLSVVADSTAVAKIYHRPSTERTAKLQAMVAAPPSDPTAPKGHISICWPSDLLWNGSVNVGFLMHRVDFASNRPLFRVYNPQDRQRVSVDFTWDYLLRTAHNLASAVEALHSKGYVVGDLNESNTLVANTAMVTMVDCDSMQVPQRGTGRYFRCPVGKAEYTAPELQGCDFSRVDRVESHDSFALGVLIFQLLMEGTHPFSGVWRGPGEPPPLEERIRLGASPYNGSTAAGPAPAAPPWDLLPHELQTLFERCFRHSQRSNHLRPTPREWRCALSTAERALNTCSRNRHHIYGTHLSSCPWCRRKLLLGGFDPFPQTPQPAPQRPTIRQPPRKTGTPTRPHAPTAGPPTPAVAPQPLVTRSGSSPGLPLVAALVALVLAVLFVRSITTRDATVAESTVAPPISATAVDEARRAEEARLLNERARIEQQIVGDWFAGASRLTITRSGSAFMAVYRSPEGREYALQAELQPDNRLKLVSDQVGKFVNPLVYRQGDFSHTTVVDLASDGSFLTATFDGQRNLTMSRVSAVASSRSTDDSQNDPPKSAVASSQTSAAQDTNKVNGDSETPTSAGNRSEVTARAEPPTRVPAPTDERASTRGGNTSGSNTGEMERLRARELAFQQLETNSTRGWNSADEMTKSGASTAYVRAVEGLNASLNEIRAFEVRFGSDSGTRALWTETQQRLGDAVTACASENRVNRARALPEIPCPSPR